ncbi:hypothetical protein RHSIM_Rhsim09G0066600 [Rhododendron simsii]|uniref:Aminotransferase-like plant mobile domain-containing protein n=1 Tax=Rhododendron simsii TaxID=118357 RepID=A0A834GGL2_RHOSS|nr:hypothetical protein RHSIM_Rhsim09G0066600 [Rhododendron simsii]
MDSKNVRVRSAKKGIHALPRPSPPVLELIRRARLKGLCSLPFVSMDWDLIVALLERWQPETHTFHLQPGESIITLQDAKVLLGILVDGQPAIGKTNLKRYDLCQHLLGEQPTEESKNINGMKVKASRLCDRFTGQVEEGADPEVIVRQARGYFFLLMGETLFADHSGGYVHLANLQFLENFDQAGMYSWVSGALANLYHNLCHGCKAHTKEITGCFILLQVWAWERLPYLAPRQLGKHASKAGAPLIRGWDDIIPLNLATHLVGAYRYHLDMQRPDECWLWRRWSEEELQPQEDAAGHGHDHHHMEHPDDGAVPLHAPPPPPKTTLSPFPYFSLFVMSPSIFDSLVVEPTGGGGSSSQTCSHSEVPWEQLKVVGFGVNSFNHDCLVEAKRRRIEESSLGDVGGSVGDGDITQVHLDTLDLHIHPQHEAEVELDFVSNNDGEDDEVEEEADLQDPNVEGDPKGGGEVTQSATKTYVATKRSSKWQQKKPCYGTSGTICKDGGGKTKRACH